MELLVKMVQNIANAPTESKFRTIRQTIPKIQSTLFAVPGGMTELIEALGFVKIDAEHFVFVGDYFKVLKKGVAMIERALEPIKVKYMTPEEREKWQRIQTAKQVY